MIGLMDCNNFFVSCERLFRPDLAKKPLAVLSSNDGCIVARSQEIKDLGIPMGVPYFQVKDICTKAGAVLFSSNFTLYRDISTRIMKTLAEEVGKCDIYSIDEAFFEVPNDITEEEVLKLRAQIMQNVGLPVSIGIASTKTLAKQASSMAKKENGACILTQELWAEKAICTGCGSVWGMGKQTVSKLKELGVSTAAEFMRLDRTVIRSHFGVQGDRIYSELQGVSVYSLGQNSVDIQKSIMSTRSFEKTTKKCSDIESAIGYHISFVAEKLREKKLVASRIYVLMQASRHSDFSFRTGSAEVVLDIPTSHTDILLKQALKVVRELFDAEVPYKKAGVVLGGLMPESYITNTLFETALSEDSEKSIDVITDALNEKFGSGTIRSGVILQSGGRGSAQLRSKEYTTSWKDIPIVHTK